VDVLSASLVAALGNLPALTDGFSAAFLGAARAAAAGHELRRRPSAFLAGCSGPAVSTGAMVAGAGAGVTTASWRVSAVG
jgi:hypothetical protein